jgi:hypothetical protein
VDELIQWVPNRKKIFIGGDFNAHVGKDNRGLKEFMQARGME